MARVTTLSSTFRVSLATYVSYSLGATYTKGSCARKDWRKGSVEQQISTDGSLDFMNPIGRGSAVMHVLYQRRMRDVVDRHAPR